MEEIPRRTLTELAFIYERDCNRRDIYVEGVFDALIIKWFMGQSAILGVAVYPIASIEIPDGEIIATGRKANNRERLVFLAKALSASKAQRAACIIDADFSILRNEAPVDAPLFQTDYASMEMYFFTVESFSKFFILCCQRPDWPVPVIMAALSRVLQEFFLYRCANDDLGWDMDWLDKNVCMTIDEWDVRLDSEAFIIRLLNKNVMARNRDTFVDCVNGLRCRLQADVRHQMHGHDLVSLLSWYIRKKGVGGTRSQSDNVLACITMTLDHKKLGTESLFQTLQEHIR